MKLGIKYDDRDYTEIGLIRIAVWPYGARMERLNLDLENFKDEVLEVIVYQM